MTLSLQGKFIIAWLGLGWYSGCTFCGIELFQPDGGRHEPWWLNPPFATRSTLEALPLRRGFFLCRVLVRMWPNWQRRLI